MTTTEATLTPTTDQTPAVAEISNELSGTQWVGRFPGSTSTNDLASAFGLAVDNFIAALRQAGATVIISATLRPVKRAYLMHWSWKIVHGTSPASVPAKEGVNIEWVHPTNDASVQAAQAMVNAYGMASLGIAPSLNSRHTQGSAIDMTISWSGNLSIVNANGATVAITSTPRTGMNTVLHTVGASYGVIKYQGSGTDRPHWSTDGH